MGEGQQSQEHLFVIKVQVVFVLSSYNSFKMPSNATKKTLVHQNLWQIKRFCNVILIDEETKKALKKTVQQQSTLKYSVKLKV